MRGADAGSDILLAHPAQQVDGDGVKAVGDGDGLGPGPIFPGLVFSGLTVLSLTFLSLTSVIEYS